MSSFTVSAHGQWHTTDGGLAYEVTLDSEGKYYERPTVLVDNDFEAHAANTVLALEDEAGGGSAHRGGLIMYGAAPAMGRHRLHLTSDLRSGPQLTLDEYGNVGIGTQNPKADLQIRDRTRLYEVNGRTHLENEPGGEGLTVAARNVSGLALRSKKWTDITWDGGGYGTPLDFVGDGTRFARFSTTNNTIRFHQKVGIGTGSPNEKLSVAGNVLAEEVIVKPQEEWSDYVFEEGYDLPSLQEVSSFIDQEGHLPAVPSAESVEKNGLHLGQMDATLLRKVEELTLYAIEQKKRADRQGLRADSLSSRMEELEKQNRRLRRQLQKQAAQDRHQQDRLRHQEQQLQRQQKQIKRLLRTVGDRSK